MTIRGGRIQVREPGFKQRGCRIDKVNERVGLCPHVTPLARCTPAFISGLNSDDVPGEKDQSLPHDRFRYVCTEIHDPLQEVLVHEQIHLIEVFGQLLATDVK